MAHASFTNIRVDRISAIDSGGFQRMRALFDVYFTSGCVLPNAEMSGPVRVETSPGVARAQGLIQTDIFNALRAEVNRLDAIDSAPVPAVISPQQGAVRYDATIATPTAIAEVDIPPIDPSPPRL